MLQRIAAVALACVVLAAFAFALVRDRSGDDFGVGDRREVTVSVDRCWRPEVTIAGRRWFGASSDPAPASWGKGPEAGVIERVEDEKAEFTAAEGNSVALFSGAFHDDACPLTGGTRPSDPG